MALVLPLIGIGLVVVSAMLFWSAVQNWMADLIERASAQLGAQTHAFQTALVVLDRVMVNGQRLFIITGRAIFRELAGRERVAVEEVRQVKREHLPPEILEKLEKGNPLEYELAVGAMKVQESHVPTYRLAVRRAE